MVENDVLVYEGIFWCFMECYEFVLGYIRSFLGYVVFGSRLDMFVRYIVFYKFI